MKKILAFLLALCLIFSFTACGAQNEPAADDPQEEPAAEACTLHIDAADWPAVDGATAFLPFYQGAAARILGIPEDEAAQYVLCSTTDYAYPNLISGAADMIFCLRPSQAQLDEAADAGVEFEYAHYSNEAFVFFVNKDNPVDSITRQQLHDIYTGKITNWKELGGSDEEIIAYQRSEGSGSQTGLYLYVASEDEVMEAPVEKRIADMGGIVDAVASYENAAGAIGYSYLYFVTNQHYDEDIKLLTVEGVAPTTENVASGDYPFISETCAVFRSDEPVDSPVRWIADWCLSDEGQALVLEKGYVGIK